MYTTTTVTCNIIINKLESRNHEKK